MRVDKRSVVMGVLLGVCVCLVAYIGTRSQSAKAAARTQPHQGQKVIEANKFRLLDDKGRLRALLTIDKDGPLLAFFDQKGEVRAMLSVSKNGSALHFNDPKGEMRVLLKVHKDGPFLSLYDENGKGRASLGASETVLPDGTEIRYPESSLLLFGPDRKVIWQAP